MILNKELTIVTYVKNYFNDVYKLRLFDIQKLMLKKIIMINNIVKNILNIKCYVVYSVMILYYFINIFS